MWIYQGVVSVSRSQGKKFRGNFTERQDLTKLKTFQIHDFDLYIQMATMKGPYCFSVGSDKTLRIWELEVTHNRYQ